MPNDFGRKNFSKQASIDRSTVFAVGGFKLVYKGTYVEGRRKGEACVCKVFKSGSVFENSFFDNEMKIVNKAAELINRFNSRGIIDKDIWLNRPEIWEFTANQEKNLMEPMITNFEKFNSNTGWTPFETNPWVEVMQALSHFSYHTSNRRVLLCDLQGGVYSDGFVITDPVIMSMDQNYGPTDLGPEGISCFFSRHVCNDYCQSNWLEPLEQQPYFRCQAGTTMMLPTRHTRQPLTRQFN